MVIAPRSGKLRGLGRHDTPEEEAITLRRQVLATQDDVASDLDMESEHRNVWVPNQRHLVRHGGKVRHVLLYLTPALVEGIERDLLPLFVGDNDCLDERLDAELVQQVLRFKLPTMPVRNTVLGMKPVPAPPVQEPGPSPTLSPEPLSIPPVAKSVLERWYRGWLRKAGAAADSEVQTWIAARAEFADRTVSRQQIRDLRGRRPRGRPKSAAK